MCLQRLGPRASPSALVFPKHEQGGVGRCVETGHWGGTEEGMVLLCAIAETLVKYRPHAVLAGGLRPDAENA